MKKVIKIAFAVVIMAAIGYSTHFSQNSKDVSDLALANVEALANNEEAGGEITCSRTCSDGVGRCYRVFDQWGNCHFSGYQTDNCTC